jgi:hypothetical protein
LAAPREPSDDELIALATSLLQDVGAHLRERHVLEEAVREHRETWLILHEAGNALGTIGAEDEPPHAASPRP